MSFHDMVDHFSYETRRILKNKFLIVLILLVAYFMFASWRFGIKDGFLVMLLTWSFFVLVTPIPDGGIVIDLPMRYFIGVRMIISEMFVWAFAITLNIASYIFNPTIYEKTFMLTLFKDIITTPFPYWLIVVLSALGTYLSLYFGDELYDAIMHRPRYKKHHMKLKFIMMASIIVFVLVLYELLLKHLGVKFI